MILEEITKEEFDFLLNKYNFKKQTGYWDCDIECYVTRYYSSYINIKLETHLYSGWVENDNFGSEIIHPDLLYYYKSKYSI